MKILGILFIVVAFAIGMSLTPPSQSGSAASNYQQIRQADFSRQACINACTATYRQNNNGKNPPIGSNHCSHCDL